MGNAGSMYMSMDFYTGLVEDKSDDDLDVSLGLNTDQSIDLSRNNFGPKYLVISRNLWIGSVTCNAGSRQVIKASTTRHSPVGSG